MSKMGEGTFGRVLECWDRKTKDYVAIKIVRNIDKYRHAAMTEVREPILSPLLLVFLTGLAPDPLFSLFAFFSLPASLFPPAFSKQ
jgi:serine/threonine protein kinase